MRLHIPTTWVGYHQCVPIESSLGRSAYADYLGGLLALCIELLFGRSAYPDYWLNYYLIVVYRTFSRA